MPNGRKPATEPELPAAPRRGRRSLGYRALVVGCQLLILGGFLGLWAVAANRGWVDKFFTSRPSDVFATIWEWVEDGSIFANVGITLLEAGLGFGLGMGIGIPVGFLLARVRLLDDVTRPYLDVLNATP
ncbi:MAG: ABC transporter permease, partial [Micromonosporaceae bacterium]|nr:ABC transporter permease [Micromonosporaceae bacterium]